jgi:hypothetical protein
VSPARQLHLNAFIHDIGHHEAAWRLPESDPWATVDVDHYIRIAQLAESAMFDSIFFADAPALAGNQPWPAIPATARSGAWSPRRCSRRSRCAPSASA